MIRRLVLPAMAGVLAAYVLVHSPALQVIGEAVGRDIDRCYFACSAWAPNGRPLDAIAGMLALIAAVGAAWLVAGRLVAEGGERLLSFGVLVVASIVVPASALGVIGWAIDAAPLRPPMGPLLTGLPAGFIIVLGVRHGWHRPFPVAARSSPSGLNLVLAATACGLLLASAVIAVVHPPTSYDALSYHAPLAVYFWREGDLGAMLEQQIWAWALAHPGTMELWAGLLRIAAGERMANLAQLPLAGLGATAIYVFARSSGLPRSLAATGALAFLIGPLVVLQAGTQRNDLTAGALVMGGAALATVRTGGRSMGRLFVAGLALGLAATAKLAMLPAVAAVLLYVLLVTLRVRDWKAAAAVVLGFAVVVAPWWGRNLVLFGNPIYPAALPFIGRGYVVSTFASADHSSVPTPALWPLYPLLEPHASWSGFGALFAVAVWPGLVAAAAHRRTPTLKLYGLIVLIALPAWWLLTRHEPRLLVPVFGLGFAFLGWTLIAVPRQQRKAAISLLSLAALFSAAVTIDQGLRPLARETSDRAEFYDRVWGVDSIAASLSEDQPLLSHTGHALLSYAADYALLGPGLQRTLITIDGDLSSDSIVGIMAQRGIRYAYVPARPDAQEAVAGMYPGSRFELVHSSVVNEGQRKGTRRYLFRLREPADRARGASESP